MAGKKFVDLALNVLFIKSNAICNNYLFPQFYEEIILH